MLGGYSLDPRPSESRQVRSLYDNTLNVQSWCCAVECIITAILMSRIVLVSEGRREQSATGASRIGGEHSMPPHLRVL